MKRVLAIIALIVAVPLLAVGLLYLIVAMAKPDRFLVAAAFLAAGTLPLSWGLLTLRRLTETSPAALSSGTIALARRLGGEVTIAQVQAEFRIPAALALETLEKLRTTGQAQAEQREGRVVYTLRGLQPSLVTRRCPYCGSEFPIREALHKCPHCGASLEVDKT